MARQSSKAVNYSKIAAKYKAKDSTTTSRDKLKSDMESGKMLDDMIEWLKLNGTNEAGFKLRWTPVFEQSLRLVADLRIGEVYTTGVAQLFKTLTNALVNAYYGQVAGLRCGWAYPEAKLIDTNTPSQHKNMLRDFSELRGAKINRSSSTSNRYYDVGIGSNRFTAVQTGDNSADAGTAIVSFTADICFAEEASQCSQKAIAPLVSRVEQSISEAMPLRYLGTHGDGSGIELTIEGADYYFWPHMPCACCGAEVLMDPRGTLLLEKKVTNKAGRSEARYLSFLGTVMDYVTTFDGSPTFACPHCNSELEQYDRVHKSYLKCIKTGLKYDEFLLKVVEPRWKSERLKVAINLSALLRDKPTRTVATGIINNGQSPATARDWCQQQLGLPSTSSATSITESQWIAACTEHPPIPSGWEKTRVMGVDQGRAYWYGAIVDVWFDPSVPTHLIPSQAIYDIRELTCADAAEWVQHAVDEGCELGLMDNEPSIHWAAELCEESGFQMADQVSTQREDYKLGETRDGGVDHKCWKLRDSKFGFLIIHAFAEGRVILPHTYIDFLADNSITSPAKHLRSVSWDAGTARITKATDDIDHLFFGLMFAVAGFCIDLEFPSFIRADVSFDWV